MNQVVTTGIILSRTDFGEADRIISVLTPDQGKLRLMAKGVRRSKSKLAGGIELFSVSNITFIRGRGDIGTLISSRLIKHYGTIVKDIDRTMTGYELTKLLDKITEEAADKEYFDLLERCLAALDNAEIQLDTIRLWFYMQLLHLGGHQPNLESDVIGNRLEQNQSYLFDFERMTFIAKPAAPFSADHIKFLRLGFGGNQPKVLQHVSKLDQLLPQSLQLVKTMLSQYVRI